VTGDRTDPPGGLQDDRGGDAARIPLGSVKLLVDYFANEVSELGRPDVER
jgi:hypothetical protein